MADNVIGISFGVAGGSSLSGESGARIKKQLIEITQAISKEPLPISFQPLKIDVDKIYFANQLDELREIIEKKYRGWNVPLGATSAGGGGTTRGTDFASSDVPDSDKVEKQAQKFVKLKEQLENLYDSYTKLDKEFDESTKKFNLLKKRAESAKKEYEKALDDAKGSGSISPERIAELESLQNEFDKTRVAQQELNNAIKGDKIDRGMQISFNGLVANGEALKERYHDLIKSNPDAKRAMDRLQSFMNADYKYSSYTAAITQKEDLALAIKMTSAELSALEAQNKTLGNKIKQTFSSKVIQIFSYGLAALVTTAVFKVYQNVIELDKSITNLQITTGRTRKETADLVVSYAKLASQLGATVTEVTSAADTWLRQGYTIAETNKLIKDTLMLSKLGQLDSAEAAKALTSAMKGYKVSVENAISIVDKFTAVDMKAAASAGDIATAMAETATSASIAGVSMDKLIGYITTVKEVTQDGAESVGTFYKTLFARMGNVKAGKFVDDKTGESLNDVETVLRSLGISLRDSRGLFRDFGDVLDDVASKWNEYTNVQQHALSTAFAGTRQQEKFITLMENYGSAIEYANTAASSGGTAQSKYDAAYLDSIEAKMKSLAAGWQEFSQATLGSGLIKFFIDLLTVIANVLKAIMPALDGATLSIIAMVAIAPAIETFVANLLRSSRSLKKFRKSVGRGLADFFTDPYMLMLMIIPLLELIPKKIGTAGKIIVGVIEVAAAVLIFWLKTIKMKAKDFTKSNSIGWFIAGISAVILAIKTLVEVVNEFKPPSYEELAEQLHKLKDSYEELGNSIKNVNDELKENYKRIAELVNLKNLGNISSEEENELVILKQKTAELNRQLYILEKQQEIKGKEVYEKASEAYNRLNIENPVWDLIDDISDLRDMPNYYGDVLTTLTDVISGMEYYLDAVEGTWQSGQNKLLDEIWKFQDIILVETGEFSKVWDFLINRIKYSGAVEYLKEFANSENATAESLLQLCNTNDELNQFIYYLIEIGAVSLNDSDSVNALVKQIESFKQVVSESDKILGEELSTLQKLTNLIGIFEGTHNILKDVQDDVKKLGVISANVLKDISDNYPSLIKYLEKVEDGYRLVDDAATKWYEDSKIQKNEDLQRDIDTIRNGLTDSVYALQGNASDKIYSLKVSLNLGEIDLKEYDKQYEEIINNLANGISEAEIDAQKRIDEVIMKANEEFELLEVAFNVIEREELINEYVDKLEKENEVLDEKAQKYKDLIDIRKDLLNSYASELNYQKELSKKQKSVADLETELVTARLDNSAAGRARVRELEGELDNAKEDLEEYTLNKAIEDICAELDASDAEYKEFIDSEILIIKETIEKAAEMTSSQLRDYLAKSEHIAGRTGNVNKEIKETDVSQVTNEAKKHATEQYDESLNKSKKTLSRVRPTSHEGGRVGLIDSISGGRTYSRSEFNKRIVFGEDEKKYFRHVTRYGKTLMVLYDDLNIDSLENGAKYSVVPKIFAPLYAEYHTGGAVGGEYELKSNEQFAKLLKGEFVSTPTQMDRFMKETLPQMTNRNSSGSINYNAPLVLLECETVTKDSLPELKQIIDEAVKKVKSEIDSGLSRSGYKGTVNKFPI